jgi:hypothetical protein
MRFVLPILIGLAYGGQTTPVVSVSKLVELVSHSASLSYDIALFTSDKLEASLSGEPRRIYSEFTKHCIQYKGMIMNYWKSSQALQDALGFVYMTVGQQIERANEFSGRILNPLVAEFEKRYPSSKGLVGETVLDRVLLGYWLVVFVRLMLRLLSYVLFGGSRRSRSTKM